MHRIQWVLGVLLLGFVSPAIVFAANDVSAQMKEEARISANEEEAEAKIPMEQRKSDVHEGTLSLNKDEDKPNPFGVIGTLSADDGKLYQLKLVEPGLLNQLKPLDQQKARLEGKVRVNGKYLVVMRVVQAFPPPVKVPPSRDGL